jgi:threonine aldolase
MRQAGVIAAAARVALDTGVDRLVEDHEHARRLAESVAELDERAVDPKAVETNMVYIDLSPFDMDGPRTAEALLAEGVLALGAPGPLMRFVTHRDVSSDDTDRASDALRRVLAP